MAYSGEADEITRTAAIRFWQQGVIPDEILYEVPGGSALFQNILKWSIAREDSAYVIPGMERAAIKAIPVNIAASLIKRRHWVGKGSGDAAKDILLAERGGDPKQVTNIDTSENYRRLCSIAWGHRHVRVTGLSEDLFASGEAGIFFPENFEGKIRKGDPTPMTLANFGNTANNPKQHITEEYFRACREILRPGEFETDSSTGELVYTGDIALFGLNNSTSPLDAAYSAKNQAKVNMWEAWGKNGQRFLATRRLGFESNSFATLSAAHIHGDVETTIEHGYHVARLYLQSDCDPRLWKFADEEDYIPRYRRDWIRKERFGPAYRISEADLIASPEMRKDLAEQLAKQYYLETRAAPPDVQRQVFRRNGLDLLAWPGREPAPFRAENHIMQKQGADVGLWAVVPRNE